MHVYVPHAYIVIAEVRGDSQIIWNSSYKWLWATSIWESNSSPQEKQLVLLTNDPSYLLPTSRFFPHVYDESQATKAKCIWLDSFRIQSVCWGYISVVEHGTNIHKALSLLCKAANIEIIKMSAKEEEY